MEPRGNAGALGMFENTEASGARRRTAIRRKHAALGFRNRRRHRFAPSPGAEKTTESSSRPAGLLLKIVSCNLAAAPVRGAAKCVRCRCDQGALVSPDGTLRSDSAAAMTAAMNPASTFDPSRHRQERGLVAAGCDSRNSSVAVAVVAPPRRRLLLWRARAVPTIAVRLVTINRDGSRGHAARLACG